MILRPYQQEAIDSIYDYFYKFSGNPLIVMPTASGKSFVIAEFCKQVIEAFPNQRIMIVTHVKELIEQNYLELCKIWQLAPAGIYSAGLNRRDLDHSIIFAGIQSIHKKAEEFGKFDLILVDEAHLIPQNADTMYQRFLKDMRSQNEQIKVIGLTATHYRLDSGLLTEGENRIFTDVCYEVSVRRLIDEGYLCDLKTKGGLTKYELGGVKTRGGEYVPADLQAAMNQEPLTVKAVTEIIDYGIKSVPERKSWLIFCAGVQHAQDVCDYLISQGIDTRTISGLTPKGERDQTIKDFKNKKFTALTNCDILCLDDKTEILTTVGWVGIDEMTQFHKVGNYDNNTGKIWFSDPHLIVRRDRKPFEKMVILETKTRSIRVTSNHRMLFTTSKKGSFKILPADSLINRRGYIPISGKSEPIICDINQPVIPAGKYRNALLRPASCILRKKGFGWDESKKEALRRHNERYSMQYKKPNELSLNECRFIGFWLGDGSTGNKSGGGKYCTFSQSNQYFNIIEWFDNVLAECGFDFSRSHYPDRGSCGVVIWNIPRGTGFGTQKRNGFFSLTPYLNKNGSLLYTGLSDDQFEALLEGLILADGLHGNAKGINDCIFRITGTQKCLYDLIQSCAIVRGWAASLKKIQPPLNPKHNQQWSLFLRRDKNRHGMTKYRMQFEAKPFINERLWCVTSESGNIITRRNGKVTIMGNTTGFNAPGTDLLVMLRPTKSTGLYVQIVGRGMRNAPGKENCLVLDFAGNIARHGCIDQIKPMSKKRRGESNHEINLAKECPECHSLISIGFRECPDCGFLFPEPKIKHDETATNRNILSAPEWADVNYIEYDVHTKIGKPNSLRVTYYSGAFGRYSEWVCLEHTGYARNIARNWWREHCNRENTPRVVKTVAEAFEHLYKLKRPCKILVREEGKYMRVLKRVFDPDHIPETNHDEPLVIEKVQAVEEAIIEDDPFVEEDLPF